MKREQKENGEIWLDCSRCGKMYCAISQNEDVEFVRMMENCLSSDHARVCDACRKVMQEEEETRKREEERAAFMARLPDLIKRSGIPDLYRLHRDTGNPIDKPLVPHVAKWLWGRRNCNLLLSGETGVGKSTSACFVALKMIEQGKRVRYVKLRKLLSEWRDARTCDERFADEHFFQRIAKLDVFILDEVIGKTKNTDSGQEMMYELLDMIGDGEIKTRLWMIGNFRKDSIVAIFGEDDPVRRRIEENFICVGIDKTSVTQFHVFQTGE